MADGFARVFLVLGVLTVISGRAADPAGLRLAVFDVDATPPPGVRMAYDSVRQTAVLGLRARGIVLMGAGMPVVLCAVDWIGIANEGHDAFRNRLAAAADTVPGRVAVHAVHQHDAPDCDFGAEKILEEAGLDRLNFDGTFAREVLDRLNLAVRESLDRAQPVTHLGLGSAVVHQVASNRRIPGPDGRIRAVRYTTCPDPELRAEPEGVIDPELTLVSFWNTNRPLAVLTYYATHPQSYYRTGIPNPDFPGIARFLRQLAVPEALHVHFNGAGGNLGAGKYNDGAWTNRGILAARLADGMRRAWESSNLEPISERDVSWHSVPVPLPPSPHLDEAELMAGLKGRSGAVLTQGGASRIAWLRRCAAGHAVDVSCLSLREARILHLPGELFVEYQLAAKAIKPELRVSMAAYGDYGPWYIGTARAYSEGGYETEPRSSNVAPEVEPILLEAIRSLLTD